MRNLNFLKALLDIFLLFAVIAILGMLIVLPLYWFSAEFALPIKIKGQLIEHSSTFSKIVVTMGALGGVIFVYSIFLLRKVLILFQNRQIFEHSVVTYFYKIGYFIIISGFLSTVPLFFYNVFERSRIGVEINTWGFDSFFLSICLGLLFMVIAGIFKHAKDLKDENDLTV